MRKIRWSIPITIVFIFMGVLLSFQFHIQSRYSGDLNLQSSENLIVMVRNLSDKRQKLNAEIADLSKTLASQSASSQDEKKLAANLNEELNKLSIVTGSKAVGGPGLKITIEQNMPILYIDVLYIVNELWAAGAEGIAINDQRITSYSNIYYAEDEHNMYITVNNKRLTYPIQIKAIGDSNNLEKGLTLPGGIIDNLSLFRAYPKLEKANSLTLPAVTESPTFIFAGEYTPPPAPVDTTTNNVQPKG